MEVGKINPMTELPALSVTQPLSPQQRLEQVQLVQAVESVNEAELLGQGRELTFALDRQTKKPVLRIVDKETKEIIRQIPPEYVLRLADELKLG
ncbi:MAG: flagellar protein FlaG [Bryobacteraceae bacterium]|nr:flagellar protein FlaG [Bryobacteraceae bacterium]